MIKKVSSCLCRTYLLFLAALACMVPASPMAADGVILECYITPSVWSETSPPSFHRTNNLRRKVGSAKFARGQFINITGRITDSNCVPVSGAVVRIWHANDLGIYQHQTSVGEGKDKNFLGAGIAVTDNLGSYAFLTIMPGAEGNRAPHIKFSIIHTNFDGMETEMFFPYQHLNQDDPVFKNQLSLQNRKLLLAKNIEYDIADNADVYEFNVTFEGVSKYKQY